MGKRETLRTVQAHRDALFTEAEKGRRRVLELEAQLLTEQRARGLLLAALTQLHGGVPFRSGA